MIVTQLNPTVFKAQTISDAHMEYSYRIQLFLERLSQKRGEPYATMSKVTMGNGSFAVA